MRMLRGKGRIRTRVGIALLAAAATTVALTVQGASAAPDAKPAPVRAGLVTIGSHGWRVSNSAVATQTGAEISQPGYSTKNWLPVTPDDAGAPGTEIGALAANGKCPHVYHSDNMRKCFGYKSKRGPVTNPRFAVPWWFRADFYASAKDEHQAQLVVNGVVGEADVWLNGHRIATRDTVTGAFARHDFEVTKLVHPGRNSLAVKMYPNNAKEMYTLDHVDWAQLPSDNNTGIQFPVQLRASGPLRDSDAHVVQHNAPDMSSSDLNVKTNVTNPTGTRRHGVVTATVRPPRGGGSPIWLSRPVTVAPHSSRHVWFTPKDEKALHVEHPKLWWPYQMGGQPLYTLDTSVRVGGEVSGSTHGTFGIRTVTSKLVGKSDKAPRGVRQYSINGWPFVVRGGGFAEDLLLRYSKSDLAHQVEEMRNLGINAVRVEGHEMPDDFYRQMDHAGILVEGGFQCCDAWQPPADGSGVSDADYHVMYVSARTIGRRLRNHPSVFTYTWSDNAPIPRQEIVSLRGFAESDFTVPIIASSEYKSSPKLGQAGEKEGPYDWVPPNYWYDTGHFDSDDPSRTNVGGAWGFDSEQSAGDTVPTLDSLKRFLSPKELKKLWTDPGYNQYHANYEPGHDGYAFGTLYNFDNALSQRYGKWHSLKDYVKTAQLQNYESARAQFEAFIANSNNKPTPSTGTIYWQLNKGWPTLLWSLYNDDGDQGGSYFGAQQANRPLHAIYTEHAQGGDSVTLANLSGTTERNVSVESRVYGLHGKLLDDQHAGGITLASQQVASDVLTPKVPKAGTRPSRVYFVELLVHRGDDLVDRNAYWRSTERDVVDWQQTMGNPQATMASYADLSALRSLPRATVEAQAGDTARRGEDMVTTVRLTNISGTPTVGLFLRADLRRGTAAGGEQPGDNEVRSAVWDRNDVTLWPGESTTLHVHYRASELHGAPPVVGVSGWNAPHADVPVSGVR